MVIDNKYLCFMVGKGIESCGECKPKISVDWFHIKPNIKRNNYYHSFYFITSLFGFGIHLELKWGYVKMKPEDMSYRQLVKNKIWKTRDQRFIPLKEMTDGHLEATINYCLKHPGWREEFVPLLAEEQEERLIKTTQLGKKLYRE